MLRNLQKYSKKKNMKNPNNLWKKARKIIPGGNGLLSKRETDTLQINGQLIIRNQKYL